MKQRNIRILPASLQLNQFIQSSNEDQIVLRPSFLDPKPSTSSFSRAQNKLQKKLTHKNTHSKTQAIQRISKYELPELNLFKNALIEMKSNEIERSSKLILNSNKNTKILNDIIDILREDKQEVSRKRQISRRNLKRAVVTEVGDNQFLSKNQEPKQKQVPVFQRGPKIINPQFIKICDGKLFERRKIFSEQRTRAKPKIKKSLNINIGNSSQAQQNPNLLTFYRPVLKKTNTIQTVEAFKNLDGHQIRVNI